MNLLGRSAIAEGDEVDAGMARWLSDLFMAPLSEETVADYRSPRRNALLAAMADETGCAAGIGKLRSALRKGMTDAEITRALSLAYALLFEGVSGPATVSLYESTYTGPFNRLYQQPVDDMALLLQRAHLTISKECCESPDHLSIELALLSAALKQGDNAGVILARDQLQGWAPQFAGACERLDQTGFYAGAATALNEFLAYLVFPEPSNAILPALATRAASRS
jgi:TorA specific chaperone